MVPNKYAPADLLPLRTRRYPGDMVRSNGDISSDKSSDISRLAVPEAAQALGISPEAVRNRLSRGTLKSEKENGSVYVLLQTSNMPRSTADTPNDTSRCTNGGSGDISGEAASLVSAKDETIRVLSEQLEAEREANRENRRIIAGLVQRVPELEASPSSEKAT